MRCGACSTPFVRTTPGLIVWNWHEPSAPVGRRPKPLKIPRVGSARLARTALARRSGYRPRHRPDRSRSPHPERPRRRRPGHGPATGCARLACQATRSARDSRWRSGRSERTARRSATRSRSGAVRRSCALLRTGSSRGRAGRCRSGSRAPIPARSDRDRSCEISRCRARSSGIELKIGSCGNSGSFGKYICVTSRERNDVPNSEK